MKLFVTRDGDVARDSDGNVIFATQEFSRELLAPNERTRRWHVCEQIYFHFAVIGTKGRPSCVHT